MDERCRKTLDALLAEEPDQKEKGELVAAFVLGIDELQVQARTRLARNLLDGDTDDARPWIEELKELRKARRELMKHPVVTSALSSLIAKAAGEALRPATPRGGVNFQ